MTGRVEVTREGPLAFVTLDHPGRLNAMSRAMWGALREAFAALAPSDARCIVVRGRGGAFCAGGDIAEYPAFRFEEASLRDFHERIVWGALQAMLDCDIPMLAQIEGACMGAGLEIASTCDIRLAGQGARFGAPIARLGFPMAPREARLVASAVGEATAREMLLEAAVLDAGTMASRGFLNAACPDDALAAEVAARAARIAALAPEAARMNKRIFRQFAGQKWAETHVKHGDNAMNSVADAALNAYAYADTPEHREGITAFLAKRPPRF